MQMYTPKKKMQLNMTVLTSVYKYKYKLNYIRLRFMKLDGFYKVKLTIIILYYNEHIW